jgi:uncharacterized membrane protein
MSQWSGHPATAKYGQAQLSFGQRSADVLRNAMGSWPFVFGALGFITLWMYLNNDGAFDPFPFILLNLVLSCVAALQGAILLIAVKREDQINSDLAIHTYQIDQENLELTKQVLELTQRVEKLTQEINDAVRAKN